MGRGSADKGCLGIGLVFLPFALGLGYVLVVGAWRFVRFLWTTGGPRLAEGDPAAWGGLGAAVLLGAVVALVYWHAGRDGGPHPVRGRAVYRGEDWHWEADPLEYPPEERWPGTDRRRPPPS
jgi:hypothetical protein